MKLKHIFITIVLLVSSKAYSYEQAQVQDALNGAKELTEADLSGTKELSGEYLGHSDLTNAKMQGSDLTGTSLYKAIMVGTKLNYAVVQGTDFRSANLTNADLSNNYSYDYELLKKEIQKYLKLETWKNFPWQEFLNNLITSETPKYKNKINLNFEKAILIKTNLSNLVLISPNFRKATLHKTRLNQSIIVSANFTEVRSLDKCNLSNTILSGSDFTGTDFDGAIVNGADFYGVKGLTGEQAEYLRENGAVNVHYQEGAE